MILKLSDRAPRGTLGHFGAAVFLVAWCAFSLAGAQEPRKTPPKYEPTEAGMKEHAAVVYAQIKALPGGDINSDGEVSKEECWAFVTALVLTEPDAILAAYPWVDANGNGELEAKEAFLFARGDYDFEKLHKHSEAEMKQAAKGGDEQKVAQFKQKMSTAEFATWHVILDRRAQLIAEAKKLPTAEFVRDVFDNTMKVVIAAGEFDKIAQGVKELAKLKKEVELLRSKAEHASSADKPKLETKAADLETHAAEGAAKLQTEITARIEKLDATGSTEEAARYRGLLKKLETLM